MVARSCGTDGGWRVEEIKKTFGSYRIYDFPQSTSYAPCILCLDQKHQIEVLDLIHCTQHNVTSKSKPFTAKPG